MDEYGVFSDEGCLEGGFYDQGEALIALDDRYADEPGVYVALMCPDHDEQPFNFCEECANDE